MDLPVYGGPRTTRQRNLLFLCSVLCPLPFAGTWACSRLQPNEAALDPSTRPDRQFDVLVQDLGDASLFFGRKRATTVAAAVSQMKVVQTWILSLALQDNS